MNLKNFRSIIIDDVTTVRNVLTKNLNELGIVDIFDTDSPLEAWNEILKGFDQNAPYDLVFCDWNMPKGDGIHLLERIRASERPEVKFIRFIMITGSNDKVLQAIDKGAHTVIHKPFSSTIIKEKIELLYGEEVSAA